jgi:hypothetical protein
VSITLAPAVSAGIHHPDMTEREVEADGIGRIDAAQRRRDVGGHLPPR